MHSIAHVGAAFSDWKSKDKGKQAVLDSAAKAERNTQMLMTDSKDEDGTYRYEELIKDWYLEGSQAHKCRTAYAKGVRDTELELWGHTRFYAPKVSVYDGGRKARLEYCADHDLMEARHGTKEYPLAKAGTYPRHRTHLVKDENWGKDVRPPEDKAGREWKTVRETMTPDGCDKR
ncbi:hypothetical protein E0L36_04525 [Streptomyces sp. AJS327]|uniref:hypothetical protein n=1 Tax=Streptomyces sp. AJS327 TaxID=2545265 RepID=UPI0015DF448A|nr:hypothetical protein [Streptomyces sp. AJS327]MBA0050188.1 hypothetical protein [Streptomyces sp. AJS327]